ncbi:unnamed protein product [Natator depressus]
MARKLGHVVLKHHSDPQDAEMWLCFTGHNGHFVTLSIRDRGTAPHPQQEKINLPRITG